MTPAIAIAMLDRQIADHGQPVRLERVVANAPMVTKDIQAFVRGYKPEELVAGIIQGDTLITISPTALANSPFADELPRRGDSVTFDGRLRTVQVAEPVTIAGALVRLNLQVRG